MSQLILSHPREILSTSMEMRLAHRRQFHHDRIPPRIRKWGMTVHHAHDEQHLEDFQYFVRITPEGLFPLSEEQYADLQRTNPHEIAHFTTEINFNYRLWLLTYSPNDSNKEQLEVNYVYETSSYEDAVLVYQQQYQMIHGHGPYDEDSQSNPQIAVEGLKLLLPSDVLTDIDPGERLFIAILSRDMACTEYFNL